MRISDWSSDVCSSDLAAFGEPNPIYAQVKLRQIEIDTQIEELRRRAAAARTEAEALAAKAEDVPRVEAEFQRLNRDYGIIKARHDELLSRRESARMSQSREAVGQDVRYRMIEPPVVANRPVGPDRALFLSAVLVLSIVAGLGGGMILVLLDTSFSSLTELLDYPGLLVLGAISAARSRAGTRLAAAAMLRT